MPYEKEILIMAGAGAIGSAQTFLVQKYLEPTQGNWLPMLGGFGRPSALLGTVLGAGAIAISYLAMSRRVHYVADPRLQFALLGYGGAALVGGVLAGLGGFSATSRAFPRTAAVRAVPAGGYSMVNKREQNIL